MIAADIYEYPAAIAAVIVALTVIGKAIHGVYGWAKRMDTSLTYIETEMRFNGGTTMRDAVKRIEQRLEVMETNQAEIKSSIQHEGDHT
jgi:hypothetical protein